MFNPKRPVTELPAFARDAEALGVDELWLAEDCFLHGGLTAAATVLAITERLVVGVGLLPTLVRNPAMAAMEIGTLAQLHPGRVRAGFGHGVDSWMRQIGARPPDRLRALAEVTSAVRALLHGETVTRDERHVRLDAVALEPPPRVPPPVLIGTTGPKGLAVAAERADGVILPEGSSPAAVRWAAQALPGGASVTVYAWLTDDPDRAVAAVEAWRERGGYPRLERLADLPEDGPIPAAVTDRLVMRSDGALLRDLWAAGATSVIARQLGAGAEVALERLVHDVTTA
jgi:alkanesulfonate monooxygenase SsuD/methylene tetrahydromethanopterin reductase-like flavin-dependent oxidoreductase (luciferase family)